MRRELSPILTVFKQFPNNELKKVISLSIKSLDNLNPAEHFQYFSAQPVCLFEYIMLRLPFLKKNYYLPFCLPNHNYLAEYEYDRYLILFGYKSLCAEDVRYFMEFTPYILINRFYRFKTDRHAILKTFMGNSSLASIIEDNFTKKLSCHKEQDIYILTPKELNTLYPSLSFSIQELEESDKNMFNLGKLRPSQLDDALYDFVNKWKSAYHFSLDLSDTCIEDVSKLGVFHTLDLSRTNVTDISALKDVHTLIGIDRESSPALDDQAEEIEVKPTVIPEEDGDIKPQSIPEETPSEEPQSKSPPPPASLDKKTEYLFLAVETLTRFLSIYKRPEN